MKLLGEVTARDVQRQTKRLTEVLGRILPQDIGKRYYDVGGGIIQIENDEQLRKRLGHKVNSHIQGKDERTLARLVKRYGTANVIGETHEIAGKRRRNPKRKRRRRARRIRQSMRVVARGIARDVRRAFGGRRLKVVKRRRRNPTVGILAANPRGLRVARRISTAVEELRYQHSQDHHWYKHKFGPGVRLELLTDGSLRLCHPTDKLWERFA